MKATDRPITGKIGQNKKFAQNKRKPTLKIYIYIVKNSNFQFAIQNLQSKSPNYSHLHPQISYLGLN